jgi:hypothetical protein
MIRFTVHSDALRPVHYTDKKGQPAVFHTQAVYVHTLDRAGKPNPYPEKAELIAERDNHGQPMAYAPGDYQLHPSSLYVDSRGRVSVAPRLAPVKTA